jgi:glycosyltransferase involved in cell wall biosynthesis
VHYLIQAFRDVQTDKQLAIVGDDPYNREYVGRLKEMADARVRFLGYVYDQSYVELCSHAYVYVQPSELEGTSPALLAAMGFGNCVVVNGIPENLETLRDRLQHLVGHPEEVEFYKRKAVNRIQEAYNWDSIASSLHELYSALYGNVARADGST